MARPYLNQEFRDKTFEKFYYEVHPEPEYENIKAFGVPTFPKFEMDDTDEIYLIPPEFEFRPDLISAAKYGRADWDFAILLLNNLESMFDFKAGTQIRLATRDRVSFQLL